jgi:hypothetical protein
MNINWAFKLESFSIVCFLEIPQFLLECGIGSQGRGTIAVTQPRRVAATSLAKRVAEEVGTTLGYKVCYFSADQPRLNYARNRFNTHSTVVYDRSVIQCVSMTPPLSTQ